MVMATDPLPAPGGGQVVHRLTWTPEAPGRVRQVWASTTDGGATWTTVFDGLYQRRD
jgi:hypothetical protein